MDSSLGFRRFVNIWVILGSLGIALCLLCVTVSLIWFTRPDRELASSGTAVFYVIPYHSPTPLPPTQTPIPTEEGADDSIPPSPPPGEIAASAYVQVSGTGGDGLRMRSEPGLNSEVKFLGLESEVFQVLDGPELVDGYTWWLLVAPYDENVRGWAVSNYLKVVQNP